jgi:hypothetical protein
VYHFDWPWWPFSRIELKFSYKLNVLPSIFRMSVNVFVKKKFIRILMFEINLFKQLGYGQNFLVHCFKKFSFLLKMNLILSPIYYSKYTKNYLIKLKQIL